jgi:hypothetical protein
MNEAEGTSPKPELSEFRRQRHTGDFYATPQSLADAICRSVARSVIARPESIIEPSAGSGAFVRAAHAVFPGARITAVDVEPACEIFCRMAGASEFNCVDWVSPGVVGGFELCIGNPPYDAAETHLERALLRAHTVAFLLRLSFLGSQGRHQRGVFKGLRFVQPIIGRPSFTSDGRTDSSEYALFVWRNGYTDRAELLPGLEWKL